LQSMAELFVSSARGLSAVLQSNYLSYRVHRDGCGGEGEPVAGEVIDLVNEAWPFVSAAAGGYGAAVLKASEESAAEAAVSWGRRILQRVFGAGESPEVLVSLAADPADADLQDALRAAMRKVLASDEVLAQQVQEMLARASVGAVGQGVSNTVSNSTIGGANIQAGVIGGDVTVRQR
jgi:hypothetical protein